MRAARDFFGTEGQTWRGWNRLDSHFARGWTAWASVVPAGLAMQAMNDYVATISDAWEAEEVRSQVDHLPWDIWSELQPGLRSDLLDAVLRWDARLLRSKQTRSQHDGMLLAMLKVLVPSGGSSSVELATELANQIGNCVLASLHAEASEASPLPSYVAHLHISHAIVGLDGVRQIVMTKALQAVTRGRDEQPIDRVGHRSGMLAAMFAVAPQDERVLDAARWFNDAVGAKWSKLVDLLCRWAPKAVTAVGPNPSEGWGDCRSWGQAEGDQTRRALSTAPWTAQSLPTVPPAATAMEGRKIRARNRQREFGPHRH